MAIAAAVFPSQLSLLPHQADAGHGEQEPLLTIRRRSAWGYHCRLYGRAFAPMRSCSPMRVASAAGHRESKRIHRQPHRPRRACTYETELPEVNEAMRRIEVMQGDHRTILRRHAGSSSADVVYFDPMFRAPIEESSGIAPLRSFACEQPITRSRGGSKTRGAPRRGDERTAGEQPVRKAWASSKMIDATRKSRME